ncbi:hypothetical protein [Rothia sp. L_38]|uniref:hypothetical protein n=1 Tax=Rothia sp. L_38 TaxID=3422315 RepID=UPI003D6B3800
MRFFHKAGALALIVSGSIVTAPVAQATTIESSHQNTDRLIQEILDSYTPVSSMEGQKTAFDLGSPIQEITQVGDPTEVQAPDTNNHSIDSLIRFDEEDQQISTKIGDAASITTGATETGAQSVITIESSSAPSEYSFDLALQDGTFLAMDEDGSVDISNEDQLVIGEVKKPWAYDANGNPVKTWFEIEDSTLTQHVEFSHDTAFPVTADPEWWQTTGTALACSGEIALIAIPGAKLAAAISKSERVIKNSKKLTEAYEKLGGKMDQVVDKIRKYFFSKQEIDDGAAAAVEELLKYGGGTLANALGIGSCYQLGVEFLGWPSLG